MDVTAADKASDVSASAAEPKGTLLAQATDVGSLGEPIGIVREITGEVLLLHTDGRSEPAAPGMPVYQDDLVSTGPGGAVELEFIDGTTFSLGGNGQLQLDNLIFDPSGSNNGLDATVIKGSFVFITGKIGSAEGEGVQIDTPAGTIGIRGTSGAGTIDPRTGVWIFTLFRDPDGTLSRFTITNPAGAQLLDEEYESTQIAGRLIGPSQTFFLTAEEVAVLFGDALVLLQEQFPQLQPPERRGELEDIIPAAGDNSPVEQARGLPDAQSLADMFGFNALADTLVQLLAAGVLGETSSTGSANGGGLPGVPPVDTFQPTPSSTQPLPPVDVDPQPNTVVEGAATGTVVGITALASDPRFGGPVAYSLIQDAGGAFVIDPVTGVITVADGNLLDFEGGNSFVVIVQATDGVRTSVASLTITLQNFNEAPTSILLSDAVVAENRPSAVIGTLTAIDPDNGDSFTFSVSDQRFEVVDGKLKLKDGVSLDHEAADKISLTVTATDEGGRSHSQQFEILVTNVNDSPRTLPDEYVVDEDSTLVVKAGDGVLANDADADGDELTAKLVEGPDHGELTFNSDGSFTYTPDTNYNGPDSFSYKASDRTVDSSVATVSLSVAPKNDAPSSVGDSYEVAEDGKLVVSADVGVLANDKDIDGDELSALLVNGPSHGVLLLNTDGSFTYTPNGNFNGEDSFTCKASDGSLDSDPVTVKVTVGAAPDSPTANNDGGTVSEGGPAATIELTGNDTDPDSGDDLEVIALDLTGTKGNVIIAADGEGVVYDPDGKFESLAAGEFAVDTFTYTVSDGQGGTDTATVTVKITGDNDGPAANNDRDTVAEDGPEKTIDLTGNDSDPDVSDDLEVTALDLTATQGKVTISADGDGVIYDPNGRFDFLADGETATDTFVYTVSDGHGGTDTATVSVTITGANDGPTAVDDSATIAEDGPARRIELTGNDTDPESRDDLQVAALNLTETLGTVSITSDGEGVVYDPGSSFEFLAESETAIDRFIYTVSDGHGGTDTAVVTVTVTGVNDGPTAVNDSATISADAPANTINLTDNDSDPDASDDLEVTAVDLTNTLGKVTIAADGEGVIYDASGRFDSLGAGETATDTFTYTVADGRGGTDTATVTVTITGANDGPVANDDRDTVSEGGPAKEIDLTGNDTDPDASDDLEVAALDLTGTKGLVVIASGGEGIVYDPNGQFEFLAVGETATDVVNYTVSDGRGGTDSATVTVTITGANDEPTANDDVGSVSEDGPAEAINLIDNDTDPDATDGLKVAALDLVGTRGTVTIAAGGDGVIYDPNGQFEFLAAGETAKDTFTYTVTDGQGGTDTATVTVTITGANDGPTSVADSDEISEDGPAQAINLTGNDSDPDTSDILAVTSLGLVNTSGMVTIAADGKGVIYDPNVQFEFLAAGETAIDAFSYTVSDGHGGTDTATVNVTIIGANDAPQTKNDSYRIDEDGRLSVGALAGVLANDQDVDGDALTAFLVAGPAHGKLSLNEDGSFTYTPDSNYNGPDSFTYKAIDGTTDSGVTTVSLTVVSTNDAPVEKDDNYSVDEDGTLSVTAAHGVLVNDSDVDGDPLTALLVEGPAHGTLTLNPDGSFIYTPDDNFNGPDSFSYVASDGIAESSVVTVSLAVKPVNDPPTAVGEKYAVAEDGTLSVSASLGTLSNDSEVDGDKLVAILVEGPAHGNLTLGADGSFVYTPDRDYNGPDSFTYLASDGTADSNVATVSLTVNPVNDPPVAGGEEYTVAEDGMLKVSTPLGVLANDKDIDGDKLFALLVEGPSYGELILNADGSFIYTPDADLNGIDSFTYKARDGVADSGAVTVNLTVTPVNDVPVAKDDGPNAALTTAIDRPLQIAPATLLGNDSDVDGDVLKVIAVGDSSHGRVVLNADGSITYIPTGNFSGTDSFTYTISDGRGGEDTAVAVVTVLNGRIIDGTEKGDTLFGTEGDDFIRGFNGQDQLFGLGGDDTIEGGNAGDDLEGGEGNDLMFGQNGQDTMFGDFGDDTLDGGEGPDNMSGGGGNDVFIISTNNFGGIDGDGGTDTLELEGKGLELKLGSLVENLSSIEQIDLTGTGNNALSLSKEDVLRLSDDYTLIVMGDKGDSVNSQGQGWDRGTDIVIGGEAYHVYVAATTGGLVTLIVDTDVTQNIN